jgi:hypothetical protein
MLLNGYQHRDPGDHVVERAPACTDTVQVDTRPGTRVSGPAFSSSRICFLKQPNRQLFQANPYFRIFDNSGTFLRLPRVGTAPTRRVQIPVPWPIT